MSLSPIQEHEQLRCLNDVLDARCVLQNTLALSDFFCAGFRITNSCTSGSSFAVCIGMQIRGDEF